MNIDVQVELEFVLVSVGLGSNWNFVFWFRLVSGRIGILCCFYGGRKTGEPGEKPSEQVENQQQTQPTCQPLEPGSQRWEASDLTTTPTLLPHASVSYHQ